MGSLSLAAAPLCKSYILHESCKFLPLRSGCRKTQLVLPCRGGQNNQTGPPSTDEDNDDDGKTKGRETWFTSARKKVSQQAHQVTESIRPKRKGDWKDVLLMSVSFAVYVYISQRIVCAYCAWMDMIHHQF